MEDKYLEEESKETVSFWLIGLLAYSRTLGAFECAIRIGRHKMSE